MDKDPAFTARTDQLEAASRSNARMTGAFYRGALEAGAPPWLAGVAALSHRLMVDFAALRATDER